MKKTVGKHRLYSKHILTFTQSELREAIEENGSVEVTDPSIVTSMWCDTFVEEMESLIDFHIPNEVFAQFAANLVSHCMSYIENQNVTDAIFGFMKKPEPNISETDIGFMLEIEMIWCRFTDHRGVEVSTLTPVTHLSSCWWNSEGKVRKISTIWHGKFKSVTTQLTDNSVATEVNQRYTFGGICKPLDMTINAEAIYRHEEKE